MGVNLIDLMSWHTSSRTSVGSCVIGVRSGLVLWPYGESSSAYRVFISLYFQRVLGIWLSLSWLDTDIVVWFVVLAYVLI